MTDDIRHEDVWPIACAWGSKLSELFLTLEGKLPPAAAIAALMYFSSMISMLNAEDEEQLDLLEDAAHKSVQMARRRCQEWLDDRESA